MRIDYAKIRIYWLVARVSRHNNAELFELALRELRGCALIEGGRASKNEIREEATDL